MYKGKIIYTGNFFEYFIKAILLFILAILTFGLLLPYYFYWLFKYFFTNMEIEMHEIKEDEDTYHTVRD